MKGGKFLFFILIKLSIFSNPKRTFLIIKKYIGILTFFFSTALLAQITIDSEEELSEEEVQQIIQQLDFSPEKVLQMSNEAICKCVDSIALFGRGAQEIKKDITRCINKEVVNYQITLGLKEMINNATQDSLTITIHDNPESADYKNYYFELERNLMDNCPSAQLAVAQNNAMFENSYSDIELSQSYYNKAKEHFEAEEYEKAIKLFELTVEADPNFAFAWDDMGLTYRYLGEYDKAIECYQKSLEVEPSGTVPIQNMAVAYIFKKDYKKAIKTYEKLPEGDPERYYGISRVYGLQGNYEKALDNICKSYNIYLETQSPLRSDAEQLINNLYHSMKENGQENKFNTILKKHKIRYN